VHGRDAAKIARVVTDVLTGKTPVDEVSGEVISALRKEQPSMKATESSSIIDALTQTNLASSNTEARRLLKENGISINGQKVARENFEASDFQDGRILLRRGKKFKDTALIEIGTN